MLRLPVALAGGLLFGASTAIAQPPSLPPATQADTAVSALKSPTTARLLGIVPGAGHMYAGEVEHGLLYLAGIPSVVLVGALVGAPVCATDMPASLGSDCGLSTLQAVSLILGGGVWAWSIFDAGRAARRTNAKRAGRTSLIVEPTRMPDAHGDNRTAVRLGMRISTW